MLLWNALEDGSVRVNAHEDGRIKSYVPSELLATIVKQSSFVSIRTLAFSTTVFPITLPGPRINQELE